MAQFGLWETQAEIGYDAMAHLHELNLLPNVTTCRNSRSTHHASASGWKRQLVNQREHEKTVRQLDATSMKTITAALIVAIGMTHLCGCMCVDRVKKIGVHSLDLSPVSFWTNSCGDRLLECQLMDVRPALSRRVDLGTRYIRAPSSGWASLEAAEATYTHPGGRAFAIITSRISNTYDAVDPADGFRLEPAVGGDYRAAQLPADCAPWTLVPDLGGGSCPHYMASASNKTFTLVVCETRVSAAEARRTDAWHGPLQMLLIPAVLIDIVTSPIQLIMILHELSKIDG